MWEINQYFGIFQHSQQKLSIKVSIIVISAIYTMHSKKEFIFCKYVASGNQFYNKNVTQKILF